MISCSSLLYTLKWLDDLLEASAGQDEFAHHEKMKKEKRDWENLYWCVQLKVMITRKLEQVVPVCKLKGSESSAGFLWFLKAMTLERLHVMSK